MLVEPIEIPDLPGEDPEEDPRVFHEAAQMYLARALDGHETARNARLAAANLRRMLDHALIAGWPLARAIVQHDLGIAALLAAEVARGERERRLVRLAREHLEGAARVASACGPPRFRGLALHNFGYACERLALLEDDARAAEAAARALSESRAVLALGAARA